jgi:hypothetical protein
MDYNRAFSVDDNAPSKPLVKLVLGNPSYYDDAQILYDLVMGRPNAGILHLCLPVEASACWKRTKLKRYESFTMLVVTSSEDAHHGDRVTLNFVEFLLVYCERGPVSGDGGAFTRSSKVHLHWTSFPNLEIASLL